MSEIIPALLVESKKEFEEKLRLVENDVDTVQVDIMDGSSVPFTSWYDAETIGAIRTLVKYELHLMVENPLPIIAEWKKYVPNLIRAIIHVESDRPLATLIQQIREIHKLEVGLALNPETPSREIEYVLHDVDCILIMGVHPGKSGQTFDGDYLFEKIDHIRKHIPDTPIGVDGGVTAELIPKLVELGIDRICAASAIFKQEEPIQTLHELQESAKR